MLLGGVPFIGLAHDERIESIMDELKLREDYFINYLEDDILTKLKERTHKLVSRKEDLAERIIGVEPAYISRMSKTSNSSGN